MYLHWTTVPSAFPLAMTLRHSIFLKAIEFTTGHKSHVKKKTKKKVQISISLRRCDHGSRCCDAPMRRLRDAMMRLRAFYFTS